MNDTPAPAPVVIAGLPKAERTTVNQTTYRTTLTGEQVQRALLAAVAAQEGVDACAKGCVATVDFTFGVVSETGAQFIQGATVVMAVDNAAGEAAA